MRCHVCGSNLSDLITDLPFKVSDTTIVILKGLPVLQCDNCSEYLLDDPVMRRVEEILQRADAAGVGDHSLRQASVAHRAPSVPLVMVRRAPCKLNSRF
jgi:YgiT-type zinc finger domain-containing protein